MGIFNNSHIADTTIQVSLIADPNVELILDHWKESNKNVTSPELEEIFNVL